MQLRETFTTVGTDELCGLLAGAGNEPLSKVAISQFVAAGMPKLARGEFDSIACLTWYVAVLRGSLKSAKHGTRQAALAALGLIEPNESEEAA